MAKRRFRSRGRFSRLRRRGRGRNRRAKRFIKAVVRRMCETKFAIAGNAQNYDSVTGATIFVVPTFNQGVDKNQRLGNAIRYKYLQLRFSIYCYVNNGVQVTSPNQIIRCILWQPRQQYTAVANPLNQGQLFVTPSVHSSINNNGCRVLMDKTHYFARFYNGMNPIHLPVSRVYKKKVRINNNVNFKSSAEVIPSDPKDQYYLTIVSNASTLAQTTMSVTWDSRISFIDI